jgi:hypothetical protein
VGNRAGAEKSVGSPCWRAGVVDAFAMQFPGRRRRDVHTTAEDGLDRCFAISRAD